MFPDFRLLSLQEENGVFVLLSKGNRIQTIPSLFFQYLLNTADIF